MSPDALHRPAVALIVLIPVLILAAIAGALACVLAALMGWV